jgi:hypothetical protein
MKAFLSGSANEEIRSLSGDAIDAIIGSRNPDSNEGETKKSEGEIENARNGFKTSTERNGQERF